MSTETLRRAAAAMREDFTPWPQHPEDGCCDAINFHNAVADWLDDEAFMTERGRVMASAALDVARAYLGESA